MKLALYNHYPAPIRFEQNTLLSPLKKALKGLPSLHEIPVDVPLATLDCIEMNLVDDVTIAELHEKFMQDPTTTDVITFQHGEVFISYDTAVREATDRGIPLEEELFRYHLHGLLHLAGLDDLTQDEAEEMHKIQEELIQAVM